MKKILNIMSIVFLPLVIKGILIIVYAFFLTILSFSCNLDVLNLIQDVDIINLVTTIVALLVSCVILKKKYEGHFCFNIKRIKKYNVINMMFVFFVLNLLIHVVLYYIHKNVVTYSINTHKINVLYIVGIGIALPILEEILFRGFLQKKLEESISYKYACVVQAIIFSIIHFDFIKCCYTFVLGIMFSKVNKKCNCLIVSILCHMVFNFTSLLLRNKSVAEIFYEHIDLIFVIMFVYIGCEIVFNICCKKRKEV